MTDRWHVLLQTLKARFDAGARTEELAAFLSREGFDRRQIDEIVARFRAETERRATPLSAETGIPLLVSNSFSLISFMGVRFLRREASNREIAIVKP